MRFSVWFKRWISSFGTLYYRFPKSNSQRKRERKRRLNSKRLGSDSRRKRKYKKRRSELEIQQGKTFLGIFRIIGFSLGILFLPLRLSVVRIKSSKTRKTSDESGISNKSTSKSKTKSASFRLKKAPTQAVRKKSEKQRRRTAVRFSVIQKSSSEKVADTAHKRLLDYSVPQVPTVEDRSVPESDEAVPKSVPKNEKDRYIQKRMIIAGSYYCDRAVLDTLSLGTYIDLEEEPNNPYDKNAVKLLLNGQKIGYIAKKDRMPFVTCLKLKRTIYGVITAIVEENGKTEYEFEAWFDGASKNTEI